MKHFYISHSLLWCYCFVRSCRVIVLLHIYTCSLDLIFVTLIPKSVFTSTYIFIEITQTMNEEVVAAPSVESDKANPEPDTSPPMTGGSEIGDQPVDVETHDDVVMKSSVKRTKVRSTNPFDGPDIVIGESGICAEEPVTIGQMMKLTVSKIPDHPALRYKTGEDTWNDVTFQQYYDLSMTVAKSFLKVCVHVYVCSVFTCVYMYMYISLYICIG